MKTSATTAVHTISWSQFKIAIKETKSRFSVFKTFMRLFGTHEFPGSAMRDNIVNNNNIRKKERAKPLEQLSERSALMGGQLVATRY